MALDRTWYNTLVDDDGTNTLGSVWSKASVDALMDAIDAQLAGIENAVWNPTLVGAGGGTAIYTVNRAVYSRASKAVLFSGRTTLSSKGSLSGGLSITGFPFILDGDQGAGAISFYSGLVTGVYGLTLYGLNNTGTFHLAYDGGAGYTANLMAAQLGAGAIDLWYSGSVTVL